MAKSRAGGPHPDPLGKRALFWVPAPGGPAPAGARAPSGKRALYSKPLTDDEPMLEDSPNPLADRGPIVVECSSCRAVSRVGVLDFLIFQLPVGVWLPRGRFDRRMTCPACRRRVWASVTLRHR